MRNHIILMILVLLGIGYAVRHSDCCGIVGRFAIGALREAAR